jgi:hypothetical protein
MGVVETMIKKFNGSPTTHYKILWGVLEKSWIDFIRSSEIERTESAKSDEPSSENERSLTETTTENTTDTEFLKKSGLEWTLAKDGATSEEIEGALAQAKLRDTAPKMFEKALGFSKPLPWWSNKEWTAFSEWVCNRYAESKISFGEYQIWRSDKYASGKMTNPRIRGFPAEFYDSWDMFLMSKETHKTDEDRPEYKPFKSDDDDLEFVARPK